MQLCALALFSLILTGCWDTGSGEKIGNIVKLARTGAYGCPTWEAEIIRGGFSGGSGVNGTSFHFTIEDTSLLPAVKKAMESRQEVKITYSSEMMTVCRSDSDNHFLKTIAPMDPSSEDASSASPSMPVQQSVPQVAKKSDRSLDRQKVADSIVQQNKEILRQNQQLIELLKETK
jgi:hypothetical protein